MIKSTQACMLLYAIGTVVVPEFHWTEQKSKHPYECYSDIKNVFVCCCEPYDLAELSDRPSIIYLKESGELFGNLLWHYFMHD